MNTTTNTLNVHNIWALALILLIHSPITLGDCQVTGATGSGGQVVNCSSPPDDLDGYAGTANTDEITVRPGAVVTGNILGNGGNDTLNILGGTINYVLFQGDATDTVTVTMQDGTLNNSAGIQVRDSIATISVSGGQITTRYPSLITYNTAAINISGGTITSTSYTAISATSGRTPAAITISGGAITGQNSGITVRGPANLTVTGGSITGTARAAITAWDGDNTFNLTRGTINGNVETGAGNDTVTVGDIAISGIIHGGSDTDTLIFNTAVPTTDLAGLQAALAAANPAGDSITINGNTYQWEGFESITDNLRAQAASGSSHAIPTLQSWALLMLSALLMLVVRKKNQQKAC